MATYKVFQKKTNKKGEAPIYISFYLNRNKVEVPTKISVNPQHFDKEKGCVKANHEFSYDQNLIISDIKSIINDIHVRYRLKKTLLTPEAFWIEYRNPGHHKMFFEFCKEFQRLRFNELQEGTQKKHIVCLKALKEFKDEIYFDDLTPEFFRKFILHLRKKRGNSDNTIRKDLKVISIYLNEAVKKEILMENPIKHIKMPAESEGKRDALDTDELETLFDIYNKNLLTDRLHNVLEFFLFMCLSSLHITDARMLKIENIGEKEFNYVRIKLLHIRPKVIRIPISNPLRDIIKHKKGNRKEGLLWEGMISDQKVNDYLKEIGEIAGIKKNLTAKVGRHTFATVFLRETKDLNTLKELMGHSNISQTMIYAHVFESDRQQGIKVFDRFKRQS